MKEKLAAEVDFYLRASGLDGQDDAVLDLIENCADRVLEEVGIRFQDDPETLEALVAIGGEADVDVVRLDGSTLRRIIRESAPPEFLLQARKPSRDTRVGGLNLPVFAPVYGAPDLLREDGRRGLADRATYRYLVELSHRSVGLTNTGHMVCVMDDVPEKARALEMLHAHLSLSDKPFMGSVASPTDCREIIELTSIASGRSAAPGKANLVHLINATPPLTWWGNPLKCLRTIAQAGEASMVSSYMMLGATGPATVVGALAQGYAETLAGMALAQIWRPGAPIIMGILGYPFDMRSMLPSFGDPVSQQIQICAAALGKRLNVPVRGDGAVTGSKINDAQAGYESGRNLATAVSSGAHFVLHSAGWLHQGRCVSSEKFRTDVDAISALRSTMASCVEPPMELDAALSQEIASRIASRGP